MHVVLQIIHLKGWKLLLGPFIMAICHIYHFFIKNKGLTFQKAMGTGKNGTFDIHPDWSRWARLTVWESEEYYQEFIEKSLSYNLLKKLFPDNMYVYLKPEMTHGFWDGKQPFETQGSNPEKKQMAVLTRATIKISKLKAFWSNVPAVQKRLDTINGLQFTVGIGEIPFIKQATLSVWDSEEHMKDFAYKQNPHKEIIKKTREEGWYSEELFARFQVKAIHGNVY
jgi:heme-degrading monooxygenase HmoA